MRDETNVSLHGECWCNSAAADGDDWQRQPLPPSFLSDSVDFDRASGGGSHEHRRTHRQTESPRGNRNRLPSKPATRLNVGVQGVAIAERGQGAMGGTPWERRESYIENSPFFYFDRIQTPLLIVQGSRDTTVAPFLGDQIFVALRRLGKKAEYARYEGEEHSPSQGWTYDHQVDLSYRIIRWLDSNLK